MELSKASTGGEEGGGMGKIKFLLRNAGWLSSRRGQTLVEYGLLAALLVIAVIAILLLLGPRLSTVFNTILKNLSTTP